MLIFTHVLLWVSAAALPIVGLGPVRHEEVSGVPVAIYGKVQSGSSQLPFIGWGVREKLLGPFSVNVYSAIHYGGSQFPKALQIVFVRDLSMDKVREAFEEALKKNGVVIGGEVLAALNRLGRGVSKGESTWLVAESGDRLVIEDKLGAQGFRSPGVAESIFTIWFGKPVDSKLAALQEKLKGVGRDPSR